MAFHEKCVAIITDGSSLSNEKKSALEKGLISVKEKAQLLKQTTDIQSSPFAIDADTTDEIVNIIKGLAPNFDAICLENIAAPKCFEIENQLQNSLSIPIYHDNQHSPAIVLLSAILNGLRLVNKDLKSSKAVICGPGVTATAIIKLLVFAGIKEVIVCDENGILHKSRPVGITDHKIELCEITNLNNQKGSLQDALINTDIFIGILFEPEYVKLMAQNPIVFAMGTSNPEKTYSDSVSNGVKIMSTGTILTPNYIANITPLPAIIKIALDSNLKCISNEMKLSISVAIADLLKTSELTSENIIPTIDDSELTTAIINTIKK